MTEPKIICKPSKTIQINTRRKNKKKKVNINFDDLGDSDGKINIPSDSNEIFCDNNDSLISIEIPNMNFKRKNRKKEVIIDNNDKEFETHNFSKFIINKKPENNDFEHDTSLLTDNIYIKNGEGLFQEKYVDEYNGFNVDFIFSNLDYDRRIKNFEQIEGVIFVDFWSIKGSLSFYKQYFNFIDMMFTEKWEKERYISKMEPNSSINISPWRETGADFNFYDLCPKQIAIQLIKIDKKIGQNKKIDNDFEENIFFEDLEERVKYFSKFSKFFSLNDVKTMQFCVETRNFEFMYINTKFLAVGANTNTLVQETIKLMNQEELKKLLSFFEYDLGPIGATKYGAYVVQVFIDMINDKDLERDVKKFLFPYASDLLKHTIGNYAVQKMLRLDVKYVLDRFLDKYYEIIRNDLGLKVFKRCLDAFSPYIRIVSVKNTEIAALNPKLYKEMGELILDTK